MKRVVATALGLLLSLFLMPLLLAAGPSETEQEETPLLLPVMPTPVPVQTISAEEDSKVTVRVLREDGKIKDMTMEDYLWSVTAAEMPASFELEALKAQAVTARTYALWKMRTREEDHPEADVCTDIHCCQAFIEPGQAAVKWGTSAAEYGQKISAAVALTDGQIMIYEGKPIQAVFFSSAAGRTEDAAEVWGNAVPYLVGVESPEGIEVPNYHSEVSLSKEEFRTRFLEKYPKAELSGKPQKWFQSIKTTSSGRVSSIKIGGVTVTGSELRALCDLRSTCFTVETTSDSVTFQVTGYGHGVGMSQYGANTLALQGKTYREILSWYYTGVQLAEK